MKLFYNNQNYKTDDYSDDVIFTETLSSSDNLNHLVRRLILYTMDEKRLCTDDRLLSLGFFQECRTYYQVQLAREDLITDKEIVA